MKPLISHSPLQSQYPPPCRRKEWRWGSQSALSACSRSEASDSRAVSVGGGGGAERSAADCQVYKASGRRWGALPLSGLSLPGAQGVSGARPAICSRAVRTGVGVSASRGLGQPARAVVIIPQGGPTLPRSRALGGWGVVGGTGGGQGAQVPPPE